MSDRRQPGFRVEVKGGRGFYTHGALKAETEPKEEKGEEGSGGAKLRRDQGHCPSDSGCMFNTRRVVAGCHVGGLQLEPPLSCTHLDILYLSRGPKFLEEGNYKKLQKSLLCEYQHKPKAKGPRASESLKQQTLQKQFCKIFT